MRARKTRNDKCECKCEVSQHTLTRNKRWTMDTGQRNKYRPDLQTLCDLVLD